MTQHLRLIEPSLAWQTAFLDMAAEFAATNDHRYRTAIADFVAYAARLQELAHRTDLPLGYVRQTTFWGAEGAIIVGVFAYAII